MNRSLLALESAVGVELIKRSTRKSEPTAAGRAFYERIQPALAEILQARSEAAGAREEMSGLLRVGAPVLFASSYVGPAVCDFLRLYPQVEVELKASDEQVDLFDEGLDLTVRIGESADVSLIARRVNSMRIVTFGAESYFARHGRPKRPQGLAGHNCIVRAGQGMFDEWPFCIDGDSQEWFPAHQQRRGHTHRGKRGNRTCAAPFLANRRSRRTESGGDRPCGIRGRKNAYPTALATHASASATNPEVR